MTHDIAPAIRRSWKQRDSEAEVLSTVEDKTRFHRGLGTSGRKVEHVEHECPRCTHDQMIRLVHVNPEERDGVSYWCLRPSCPHFVADELSWATKPHPSYPTDTPEVWDNTAICPRCDSRHTVELRKGMHEQHEYDESGKIVTDVVCDDCMPSLDEAQASSITATNEEL